MKTLLNVVILTLVLCAACFGQAANIVPKPVSVSNGSGKFVLSRSTKIVADGQAAKRYAAMLNDHLKQNYGFELKVANKPQRNNVIRLVVNDPSAHYHPEGYVLRVSKDSLLVSGVERGIFYAIQTLKQMMPLNSSGDMELSAVEISDRPRFAYRGMHLDVSRHFQPVSFVKKFIDQMAQYKFNNFHWHLTDDQGWRIEIKKYPKLTETGAKRPETVLERNLSPYIGDKIPHGGFYTQEEIRDVVAYAKARHVTVIPEIELPGHASAALAAYPQLGCKTDYKYKVQTTWGIFKEVFCPTDETFKFLEDVLDETIALFPDSPYIHIGGDEVLKDHWKESAFVQELKKRENLKDEHEVQSYFVQRIERFVNSKGKKIIGWDEILEGGLAPNATVMSWRGMKGGIEAAKAKHDVIMAPTDYSYFDYGQGDPAYEPLNIGSYVPLEKVYSFEPIPAELTAEEAKYVIGGQANIWTEYIKTSSHVEYMAFPRMLALSEVLWSRKQDRNLEDFNRRLALVLPRLDKQGVNYRMPEPMAVGAFLLNESEAYAFEVRSPVPGGKVHYTKDGSTPTENSPEAPVKISVFPVGDEVVTVKTIVVMPNGRKSPVYAATFLRGKLLEPVMVNEPKPGVKYVFSFGDESAERSANPGETRSILINQFAQRFDLKKPFTVQFDGYIKVPADGVYEIQADSTWDATVVLGGKKIIDDAGTAESKKRHSLVPLKAGLHNISMRYNHRGGDLNFRIRWALKGQGLRQAYGGEFVH